MALVTTPDQQRAARELKELLSRYAQVRDMLPLGAYVPGADPVTDRAVALYPRIEDFLRQGTTEAAPLDTTLAQLDEVVA